ncbi:UNVERIFIED_ORG: hypothetical protein [Escherichia phage CMSTMSU]
MRKERKHLQECMDKFVNFSNGILAEELKEFHIEKRQLVETRVKLAEGSVKLLKHVTTSSNVHLKVLLNILQKLLRKTYTL